MNIKKTLGLATTLLAANLFGGLSLAAEIRTLDNVVYAERDSGDLTGDLHLPVEVEKPAAVVMIHGGGWIGGERADMDKQAKALAEQGFAVFNITYRLAPAHRFPAALIDCRDAVRFLRREAAQFGIDAERIGAWGYSAGGHLAASLATVPPAPLPGENSTRVSPRILAAVDGAGPTDLRLYPDNKYVSQFMPEDADEALYVLASPVAMVSEDDAPVFMYHGKRDVVVDYRNSTNLQQQLQELGIEAQLATLPFGHVLTFLFPGDAREQAYDFLRRRLYP